MSGHDKKPRPVRVSGKPPLIAAPPRVALGGRSKAEPHDDGASIKSVAEGAGSEADEPSAGAKDRRISELEALAAEHERELAQLRQRRQEEAETAAFWQKKHSTLNQAFLRTDTDLRLLRQEAGAAQQGREDRDRDIKTRISSLLLDREAFREAYNEAMGELSTAVGALSAKDDTIKALQSQVSGLKNFVSASSKMDEQVTDEVFGEQMQRLGNSLQNWVITNFRRAKIGMPFLQFLWLST
jgi:chromosome segregation ATPase